MLNRKILICGDSFAASDHPDSWVSLLRQDYEVENLSQAGVSEYKIWRQLTSMDPYQFDMVIICHTDPHRVHTRKHPIHKTELHKDCDLLWSDIAYHGTHLARWFNRSLDAAVGYFIHHFDEEYYDDVYGLLVLNMRQELSMHKNVIEMSGCWEDDFGLFKIAKENPGKINHMSPDGNRLVFQKVRDIINE